MTCLCWQQQAEAWPREGVGECRAQEGRPCTHGEGDMSGRLSSRALQFLGSPSAVLSEPDPSI